MRRGAVMIEAALIMGMLVLFLIGIMEVGRAFMTYNLLTHAVREGARLAVVTPTLQVDDGAVLARISALLKDGGVVANESTVTFTSPVGRGTTIRVKTRVDFIPVTAMVFGTRISIPLQSEVVARHE